MESYHGLVLSPKDAVILLEASRQKLIPTIRRRLTERERIQLIRNGAVFVWNEQESGMKRWTDGISWSASRVDGAFLMYKEMESGGFVKDDNAYRYKQNGLTKQSFSVTLKNGVKLHLISYVSNDQLREYDMNYKNGIKSKLIRPSEDPRFQGMELDTSLYPYQEEQIDVAYDTFLDRRVLTSLSSPAPKIGQQQMQRRADRSKFKMYSPPQQHLPSIPQPAASPQSAYYPPPPPQMSYILTPAPMPIQQSIQQQQPHSQPQQAVPIPKRPGIYHNHSEDGRMLSYLDKCFI